MPPLTPIPLLCPPIPPSPLSPAPQPPAPHLSPPGSPQLPAPQPSEPSRPSRGAPRGRGLPVTGSGARREPRPGPGSPWGAARWPRGPARPRYLRHAAPPPLRPGPHPAAANGARCALYVARALSGACALCGTCALCAAYVFGAARVLSAACVLCVARGEHAHCGLPTHGPEGGSGPDSPRLEPGAAARARASSWSPAQQPEPVSSSHSPAAASPDPTGPSLPEPFPPPLGGFTSATAHARQGALTSARHARTCARRVLSPRPRPGNRGSGGRGAGR